MIPRSINSHRIQTMGLYVHSNDCATSGERCLRTFILLWIHWRLNVVADADVWRWPTLSVSTRMRWYCRWRLNVVMNSVYINICVSVFSLTSCVVIEVVYINMHMLVLSTFDISPNVIMFENLCWTTYCENIAKRFSKPVLRQRTQCTLRESSTTEAGPSLPWEEREADSLPP